MHSYCTGLSVLLSFLCVCTLSVKERATKRLSISLPNIDNFREKFRWHTEENLQ